MRYLLLIYDDEKAMAGMSEAEGAAEFQAWMKYTEDLGKTGKMRGGEALQPVATATTLRLNGGNRAITDGPFAETKEQLGGFYIVEAENIDEAINLASGLPHLPRGGSVELRPIMEFDTPHT